MISDWNPEYILLTGIAIGISLPTVIGQIFNILRRVKLIHNPTKEDWKS